MSLFSRIRSAVRRVFTPPPPPPPVQPPAPPAPPPEKPRRGEPVFSPAARTLLPPPHRDIPTPIVPDPVASAVGDAVPIFGDAYWQSRAEDIVDGMDVMFYYATPEQDYLDLGDEFGNQRLVHNLLIQAKMQSLYWDDNEGDRHAATELYLHRDEEFPDWFWRYHGVYA